MLKLTINAKNKGIGTFCNLFIETEEPFTSHCWDVANPEALKADLLLALNAVQEHIEAQRKAVAA